MKSEAYQDNPPQVQKGRLWFGFTASTAAWIGLGLADGLITWRACVGEEQWGGAHAAPGLLALLSVITFLLLGLAAAGGVLCYRNWRRLSGDTELKNAEASGRKEYVALIGLFMSVTLGVGIIWLGLPLIILKMCVRTR